MNLSTYFWLTTSILLSLLIISFFLYKIIINYINKNLKIGIYPDMKKSLLNQTIYLNLVNIKNKSALNNTSEDLMRLYASGIEINAVFYKTPEIPNGYKIAYATTMSNVEIISMISGIKYNTLEVSFDGGMTRTHVYSIHDKLAEKISIKLEREGDLKNKHKIEMIDKIVRSGKTNNILEATENDRVLAHVNETKSTGTSFRFQVIVPKEHPFIVNNIFNPNDLEMTKLYYIFEGHCYEFKYEYIGQIENLHEWDVVGLKPNRIYAGLSFSLDGGKTILPSSALYGITRNKHGEVPTIDETILAKPKEIDKKYKMWNESEAIGYMGKNLTKKVYSILVKKHYEDEYSESYLALSKAHELYNDYEWLNIDNKKNH